MSRRYSSVCAATLLVGTLAASAGAQPIGTFRWQLQPYCNLVTFAVTPTGGSYTLDGYDDQCGAATRAPATGIATVNPDSTVEFGLNIVVTPAASPIHVAATISLATLSGTWRDQTGASGTFVFTPGAGSGGNPRPVATTPQWIPDRFALRPDGGFLAEGSASSGVVPASGAGTRLMWDPGRSALRAGRVSGTQWDQTSIGSFSVAFGSNTIASGQDSIAVGFNATANGNGAVALGIETIAGGLGAVALGYGSEAHNIGSFASGFENNADGSSAVAMGEGRGQAATRRSRLVLL